MAPAEQTFHSQANLPKEVCLACLQRSVDGLVETVALCNLVTQLPVTSGESGEQFSLSTPITLRGSDLPF